ncbi:MAG: SUMF1/EgtB/PvdO family nonheme iron enzyme [Acidobacteriota bacterium]
MRSKTRQPLILLPTFLLTVIATSAGATEAVFVRGTHEGAQIRLPATDPIQVELTRPTPSRLIATVTGSDFRTDTTWPSARWIQKVQVFGQRFLGGDQSRIVIDLAGSHLQPRFEIQGADTLLILSSTGRPARVLRPRRAAEPRDVEVSRPVARPLRDGSIHTPWSTTDGRKARRDRREHGGDADGLEGRRRYIAERRARKDAHARGESYWGDEPEARDGEVTGAGRRYPGTRWSDDGAADGDLRLRIQAARERLAAAHAEGHGHGQDSWEADHSDDHDDVRPRRRPLRRAGARDVARRPAEEGSKSAYRQRIEALRDDMNTGAPRSRYYGADDPPADDDEAARLRRQLEQTRARLAELEGHDHDGDDDHPFEPKEGAADDEETPLGRRLSDGMIRIEATTYVMGTPAGLGFPDEAPPHQVSLSAFDIDATEVSVAEFQASGLPLPRQPGWNFAADQPVVNVTWEEAAEYCSILDKRLPTEAEWELAARGPQGSTYPWGDRFNTGRVNSGVDGDGHVHAAPVESFPEGASPYGVLNLSGNVWEWVGDWYSEDAYIQSGATNPTGPPRGSRRVTRGGSFRGRSAMNVRSAVRQPLKASVRSDAVGFRCAR